mgnify:FL=1
MLLDKVLRLYDTEPDLVKRRQPSKGNPTASAAGACAAQLQMLRVPHLTHPEIRPIRAAWTFEDGDMHAEDLKGKLRRAFPGLGGLSEELFYFPVPIDAATERHLIGKIHDRSLWGTIIADFHPPRVAMGTEGAKDRVRLAPRDDRDPNRPKPLGFVVDPGTEILWAPLYVDHVIRLPDMGRLCVVEFKSQSRFAFRRALMGQMGYKERVQLAMTAEATGLDPVWFVKCKDTAHTLEIAFVAGEAGTRVTLLRTNGQQDTFWIKDGQLAGDHAGEQELREDPSWDAAEVWTPRDPAVLAQARERILRVLLHEPPDDPQARLLGWWREYGPTFACPTCGGTGLQTMQKSGRQPLKKPKPCEDCNQTGWREEADLPWQCSYCPCVLSACYPFARLELTDQPRYIVKRADFQASGVTVHDPEPMVEAGAPAQLALPGGEA